MDDYLKALVYVLPLIVASGVLKYFLGKYEKRYHAANDNKPKKENSNILKFPLFFRLAPLGLVIFLLIMVVFCLFQNIEDWPYAILFGFITLPCILIMIFWSLWRVEIRDEEFEYRNWFGKKKIYRYEDLELRHHPKGLKWFFYKGDKKVFTMAYFIENGAELERCFYNYTKKINKD